MYDAWGNITSQSGSMATVNPIRYRGYYYDEESGFYYLQSRYYDPKTGRFINADSLISGDMTCTNLYVYCGNNPVIRTDPSGLLWEEILNAIETAAKIVAQVTAKAAASAAAAANNTSTTVVMGGGIYRQIPNGLASALTAQSNSLSAISTGAGVTGKIAGIASVGIAAIDATIKVYDNFNNDDLSLSRKISDSVVDVGVTAGSIWGAGSIGAAVGSAIPIPGVGTAVGFGAGIVIGAIVEYTPVVDWVKEGVGWVADKVGGFFGKLFS
ncbi:RHS repeat-associated core domain-containing protein [Dysgonomonas capnocytophagoides]|uniref:RHS repeat-associated core domain-containing protein n=1 Tax=Dysgonomonas capnocytophagoides TaxID=45254 RepID=UPI002A819033|nr:RHS repeat-associated core domain-containing protein [Dysgonomonas capnocytophagoides]